MRAAELALKELQRELTLLENSRMDPAVIAELAFQASDRALNDILGMTAELSFNSSAEQVKLFKEILPAFYARKEYYRLLNYAVTFCPDTAATKEKLLFWPKQAERLENFRSKNAEFLNYHESNRTDKDEFYYGTESDNQFVEILGNLWAREQYRLYALGKIEELSK
ncbi:MAG: hypothetical protein EOO88_43670 [Pedobacter sp.]|nr:MAG: hypothetical protein EOO88_43670 [Pedobacter sp.]